MAGRSTDEAPWHRHGELLTLNAGETHGFWLRAPEFEIDDAAGEDAHDPRRFEEDRHFFFDSIRGPFNIQTGTTTTESGGVNCWMAFTMLQYDYSTGNPEQPWDWASVANPFDDRGIWNALPFFFIRRFHIANNDIVNWGLWDEWDNPWWLHVNKKVGRVFGTRYGYYPAVLIYNDNATDSMRFQAWWTMYLKR